jgi:hypothetical protein
VLKEQQREYCYIYQANYLLKESSYAYEQVFADCDTLAPSFRRYCLLGLGASLAGFSTASSLETAAQVCGKGTGDASLICVQGAIPSLFARYGGETSKITQFCFEVGDGLKEQCFRIIGEVGSTWDYSGGGGENVCRGAGKFEELCLGPIQRQ